MRLAQRYLAELLGTFTLVLVGIATIAGVGKTGLPLGLAVVPLAFGLALLAGLYAFGEVSGGHFNPAVSLGMFLDRRLGAADLVGYWIAQFLGGILAALILLLASTKAEVATTVTQPSSNGTGLVMEIVLTAIFVAVVLQATRSEQHSRTALLAIPLTFAAMYFASIPFSGGSANPARSLGPAVVGNVWHSLWLYFAGPAAGAVIAWLVHTIVVRGELPKAPSLT